MGQVETVSWTDIVTAIAAAVTVVILIIAALYARHQLGSIERTRETQLLTDLARNWDEESLRESRQAVEKYEDGAKLKQALKELKENNDKQYYVLLRLSDFFEELELLVNYECLSPQLAKDMFGTAIKYHYTRYEPTIKFLRAKYKSETIYKFFEDLANKCQ